MDESAFGILERVELAARERRLAASTTADAILAAARESTAHLETDVPARAASAIAALRAEHRRRAAVEIAAIDAELAAFEAQSTDAAGCAGHEAAVALIVAAVLGEPR